MIRQCTGQRERICVFTELSRIFSFVPLTAEEEQESLEMDYLKSPSHLTEKARSVAAELDQWIEEHYHGERIPIVELSVTTAVISICIADCTVWDSENFPDFDLYRDKCLDVFRDHALNLALMFADDNLELQKEEDDDSDG